MSTRIYDSSLLDFQVAPCMDEKDPLNGLPLLCNKATMNTALSGIMDAKTLNDIPERFMPVSLRWRASTALGLPYSPFKVYKRKKADLFTPAPVPFAVVNDSCYFINGPYWSITFTLKNPGLPTTVQVAPLDQNQQPIAGAQMSYPLGLLDSVTVSFNLPNINGIGILSGSGNISNVMGVRMEDMMNDSKWKLIETVGMPFKTGTPAATAYLNSNQGYPAAPVSGYQAGINRVALASLFAKAPSLTQPDGTVLPAWTVPKPAPLIDSYHVVSKTADGRTTGVLCDIEEMLRTVQNSYWLYEGKQAFYRKEYRVGGFTEDGTATSGTALVRSPVCGATLLGVATDCWNALGLGFGTTDLTSVFSGVSFAGVTIEYDYMVVASFRLPKYNVLWETFTGMKKCEGFETYEIASLAHPALPLMPVTNLKNEAFAENRPLKLDGHFSDEVKLFWDKTGPNVPTAYAVAIKDMFTGKLEYLNVDRPFIPGIKRPYLAADRADNDAQDVEGSDAAKLSRFFHHRSERSDTADTVKNYYVAATDVFGRWSAFQKTVSVLPKAPMINADIITGKFVPDVSAVVNTNKPHNYPAVLELVIAWHWDDRSPFEINIGGHFEPFPANHEKLKVEQIALTPKIALDVPGTTLINLSIGFNGKIPYVKKIVNQQPQPAGDWEATIIKDDTNSAPPHTMSYKLIIKGFQLNFEAVSKLGYAAYVRSSVQLAPLSFTSFGSPKMFYVMDPLPRNAPVLPPDIQWSSLPDATNVSRFRVQFPAVANVAGYAIYRATEAALREKLQLPGMDDNDDITTRRNQLFAGYNISDARNAAKDAFIRISSNLIKDPVADVELPGDLNGIYIYAMTTFTEQRVESEFSSWMYVSVPRRYTPSAPSITAFTAKKGNQREVMLRIEVPQGIRTERLELFSTGKSYLAASPDLMGLPFTTGGVKKMPAGWKAYDAARKLISPVLPDSAVACYEVSTTVAAGWQPLYYCATAFGTNDPVHGKLPGRSKSSNMISIQVAPPDEVPEIDATLMPVDANLWRMDILATADIQKTPYGNFRLTVRKLKTGLNLYEDLFTVDVADIKKKEPGDPLVAGSFYRLGKDASGKYEFEYFAAAEEEAWYQIVITDPLGRTDAAKVHYKNPVVEMRNLVVKPLLTSVEVTFEINISNKQPVLGHYLLEIYTQGTKRVKIGAPLPVPVLAYSNLLDNLLTTIPNTSPAVYMMPPAYRATFFTYTGIFKGSASVAAFTGATVIIVITDPNGKKTQLTNGSGAVILNL